MKRRTFFQGIVKAAGIIALAPQLCFKTPAIKFGPESVRPSYEIVSATVGYNLASGGRLAFINQTMEKIAEFEKLYRPPNSFCVYVEYTYADGRKMEIGDKTNIAALIRKDEFPDKKTRYASAGLIWTFPANLT